MNKKKKANDHLPEGLYNILSGELSTEDKEDLKAFEERKNEPCYDFKNVIEDLRKQNKI